MSLKETIETEYKKSLKSKDKTKISTYRLILSSIKDLDILNRSGPNKKETDDEDIVQLGIPIRATPTSSDSQYQLTR